MAIITKDLLNILKVRNGWPCSKLSNTEESNLVRKLHSSLIVVALKHLKGKSTSEAVACTSGVNEVKVWVVSETDCLTTCMLHMRSLGLFWVL